MNSNFSQAILHSIEMTKKLYDDLMVDVIKKLTEQSTQGSLQMNESEITNLRHYWESKLQEIRSQNKDQTMMKQVKKEEVQQEQKRHSEHELNDQQEKKIKLEQNNIKEEQESDDSQVSFEKPNELTERELEDVEHKNENFQKQDRERNRERTLFDKIRKLKNDEANEENGVGDGESENEHSKKQFSMLIFAEKKKKSEDYDLVRIKPNKQQKAYLEHVIIQQQNKEWYMNNANVTFTFKTK